MADPLTRTRGRVEAAAIPATRLRVPTIRLSRIRSFFAGVQRPFAIDSPRRFTTTSIESRELGGGGPEDELQARMRVAGSWRVALDGSRERTVTSFPRASRR